MPVRERAALGVLTGQAHRNPLDEQRRERERLGLAPVDAALVDRLAAPLELAQKLRVDREALGHARAAARSARAGGRPRPTVTTSPDASAGSAILAPASRAGRRAERLLQPLVRRAQRRLHLLDEARPLLPRRRRPPLRAAARTARARAGAPRFASPSGAACTRARPARCVRGAGSRRGRSTTSLQNRRRNASASRIGRDRGLGIVGVHVDDRDVEALREVARVSRRAALLRARS